MTSVPTTCATRSSSSPTCGCATRRPRCARGEPTDNFVAPDDLSSFDKRHLREAFAIVRAAQSALAHRYPVPYIS